MKLFKSNFVVGVTTTLTATIIAPPLLPTITRSGRPLAKTLARGALALYEMGREAAANAGEIMKDAIAEARAEQGLQKGNASGNESVATFGAARNDNDEGNEPAAGGGGA